MEDEKGDLMSVAFIREAQRNGFLPASVPPPDDDAGWRYLQLVFAPDQTLSARPKGRSFEPPSLLEPVEPPRLSGSNPADELASFAERSAARHRTVFRLQIAAVVLVGSMIAAMLGLAAYWVTTDKVAYGAVFGAGGLGAGILGKLKWEPFVRLGEARQAADGAELVSISMRRSLRHIDALKDPAERLREERRLVATYLAS